MAVSKIHSIKTVLCDLDGVIWLAHEPIDGSVAAIAELENAGINVLFVTNNSFSTQAQQREALSRIGIEVKDNLVTSAMAAASCLEGHERVLVCGGEGLIEEVGRVAREIVVPYRERDVAGDFDAVVVGFHREFDFHVLSCALTAVRAGARLLGSNSDPTYPTPYGPIPGGGAILAAIEHATGVKAVVAGKPHATMARYVHSLANGASGAEMLMVGDVVATDGAFAQEMQCAFALVLSGMTSSGQDSQADLVGENLADIVFQLLNTQ